MDIKLFMVSPLLKGYAPQLIVWADDAQAALEVGADFIQKLQHQNAASECPAHDDQTQDTQTAKPPGSLVFSASGQAVHFPFHGHRYAVRKNQAVLVQTQAFLESPVEAASPPEPAKDHFLKRLFDYSA